MESVADRNKKQVYRWLLFLFSVPIEAVFAWGVCCQVVCILVVKKYIDGTMLMSVS
ncbi:hypothetical protein ABKX71_003967 [Aeromonas veronii]|uniref:hypothetical protein n=1 Tax=Aeromonas TaxID=642 RepID=UPI0024442BCA|nr:hypothetical protein [Aeromonas veronii]